jgi:hypothetical protein
MRSWIQAFGKKNLNLLLNKKIYLFFDLFIFFATLIEYFVKCLFLFVQIFIYLFLSLYITVHNAKIMSITFSFFPF